MSALDVTDRPPAEEQIGPDDFPFGPDEHGPAGPRQRWHLPAAVNWPEALITGVIVLFLCGFVFRYLQPSKLFLNSTPAGGDMGAHVWQPAFMRDHLLTHFRLTGWANDWYAGFPSLVFYFPLPALMIVILGAVLPYDVAFKLVSVLGLVTLPLSAWAFGRLARFRFPGPACLAVATLPFLFATNYSIYGGNVASTLAGEFGFSISLSFSLVFLGLVARGLETGKYRGWAAIALVATGLCHLLPAIFAIVGALVLTAMRWDRRTWRWMAPVFAVAGGLAAFWWLPFLMRLPYATDMGYEKITQYWHNLFPPGRPWFALFLLAFLGAALSLFRRQRLGIFLTIMAVLAVLIFRFAPQARLWNARVLPFWFLCVYLLAAVAVAEGGGLLLQPLKAGKVPTWSRASTLAVPIAALITVWLIVGFPLHALPGGSTSARTGKYTWGPISTSASSYLPSWAKWNYSGYQSRDKSRRAEYFGLINTMTRLGKSNGCGRAMWEYEPGLDQMGTPDALMLLPYWTNSCIGSMEGLYYESSATTPYHFINAAELSLQPSDPVRGLTYPATPNVADGVRHLQLLGVKYYMALTADTQKQADANADLQLVGTSGPWPESYSSGPSASVKERTWKIYEVASSALVAPLANQPVVMKGISGHGLMTKLTGTSTADSKKWLLASQAWYLDQNVSDVMYAATGPSSWPRVASNSKNPPRNALPAVLVDGIKLTDNSVSFNVDTVGVPVLVKMSYFPSWQASGAKGPYRVAPNLMVVIPTSHHVTLHYGYTPADWLGFLFCLSGLAALVWLFRAKPVLFSTPRSGLAVPAAAGPAPDATDAYQRLHRELEAGLTARFASSPSDPGDARPPDFDVHPMDAWLGFPGGLGALPPPSSGNGAPPVPSLSTGAAEAQAGDGPHGTGESHVVGESQAAAEPATIAAEPAVTTEPAVTAEPTVTAVEPAATAEPAAIANEPAVTAVEPAVTAAEPAMASSGDIDDGEGDDTVWLGTHRSAEGAEPDVIDDPSPRRRGWRRDDPNDRGGPPTTG